MASNRPEADDDFFYLKTCAGYAWPRLPAGGNSLIWSAYRELERSQWLTPDALRARQCQQLRALLRHSVARVPYYRALMLEQGITVETIQTPDDIRRLPRLSRRTYQARLAEFRAERLPPGTRITGQARTSGTSGLPITVLRSNITELWWLALFLRDLHWCDLDPRGSLAAIRPSAGATTQPRSYSCWYLVPDQLIDCGPSHLLNSRVDPERQLAWLQQLQPDYLLSTPSNLDYLARLTTERGLRWPRLRMIQSIAESLPEAARARIEAGFGVAVKNTYSCEEGGYLASPCPTGAGLHVHAESVLIEVVDEHDRPCAPGANGRVLLTTLHNYAAPLIRYDIGDRAALAPEPACGCGRGLPLLTRVSGKERPPLLLNSNQRKDSHALGSTLNALDGVYQFQLVQHRVDRFTLNLVPAPGYMTDHGERFAQALRDYVDGPVSIAIKLHQGRIPSPNGKLRSIVVEA